MSRAIAVCSGVDVVRVRAVGALGGEREHLRSERGEHAARDVAGWAPKNSAASIVVEVLPHRRRAAAVRRLVQPSTIGLWLTPSPRTNRSGNASSIVRHAAFVVIASRP